MTARGQAKILDFGLVKVTLKSESVAISAPTIESEDHLTCPGSVLGTVAYMSPEQVRGRELDARTMKDEQVPLTCLYAELGHSHCCGGGKSPSPTEVSQSTCLIFIFRRAPNDFRANQRQFVTVG